MLRVGINATFWNPNQAGGIQTFLVNLIWAIDKAIKTRHNIEVVVFCNNWAIEYLVRKVSRVKFISVGRSPAPRWKTFLWENLKLPKVVRSQGLDVLHSVNYYGPVWVPCKHMVTIHDVNFEAVPYSIPAKKRIFRRIMVKTSVHNASGVATVSKFSAREIKRRLGIKKPIYVVGNAPNSELMDAYSEPVYRGGDFIFSLASTHKHKNLEGLLDAYKYIFDKFYGACPELVLAGLIRSGYDDLMKKVDTLGVGDKVRFLGYVSVENLRWLYENAIVFVFPSLYEGFGIPVLEAMSFGCPVVSSNAAALPEVVGDAGILVDARDKVQLGEAIISVMTDGILRNSLISRGYARSRLFTWDACANTAIQSYHSICCDVFGGV